MSLFTCLPATHIHVFTFHTLQVQLQAEVPHQIHSNITFTQREPTVEKIPPPSLSVWKKQGHSAKELRVLANVTFFVSTDAIFGLFLYKP